MERDDKWRDSGLKDLAMGCHRQTPFRDLPEYLSVEEFYQYVGISRSLAYDLIRREEIPHRRFGRRILTSVHENPLQPGRFPYPPGTATS